MSVLGTLLRMRLRRDRWQLVSWVVAFLALIAVSATELNTTYSTEADREAIVRLAVTNTSLLLARGAPQGTGLGEIISFQILAGAAFLAAVMTSMMAVRHVRGDEEAGRSEIVGASVAGRFAPTVATAVEGVIASVAVGVASSLGLLLVGLPVAGCLAFGTGCAICGLAFLGVGLVAAQVFSTSRTANGVGIALVGIAWVVRGIGDIMGTPAPDGHVRFYRVGQLAVPDRVGPADEAVRREQLRSRPRRSHRRGRPGSGLAAAAGRAGPGRRPGSDPTRTLRGTPDIGRADRAGLAVAARLPVRMGHRRHRPRSLRGRTRAAGNH